MKILLISNIYPEPIDYRIIPDTRAIHYFAKDWIEKGHEVLVIHPYWNPLGKIARFFKIGNHKIREYAIDGVHVIFGESQILIPHKYSGSFLQQILLSRRFLKYISRNYSAFIPDCVVVHFPVLSPFFNNSFLISHKSYCTLHGVDIRTLTSLKGRQKKYIIESINNNYERVLYRSKVLKEQGETLGLKKDLDNVIFSGIDSNLIASPNEIANKLKNRSKCLKLIYAGKINRQKRIDIIINALALLDRNIDFCLNIIGDGPERCNLLSMVNNLGLSNKVIFSGRKTRQEVSRAMFESDVFVMLSKGETLGLVYLEAMAQGCIAIGSRGEGIDGIIQDGENGFLCSPDDAEDLLKTFNKIISLDMKQFMRIAMSGYEKISGMSSESMSNYYLSKLL